MANYLRDLTRVVLMSSDALQTDIQRIQLLQKVIERFSSKIFHSVFSPGENQVRLQHWSHDWWKVMRNCEYKRIKYGRTKVQLMVHQLTFRSIVSYHKMMRTIVI